MNPAFENKDPALQNKAPVQVCMEKMIFMIMAAPMCIYSIKLWTQNRLYMEVGFLSATIHTGLEQDIESKHLK